MAVLCRLTDGQQQVVFLRFVEEESKALKRTLCSMPVAVGLAQSGYTLITMPTTSAAS
jgi:hypothetical protein